MQQRALGETGEVVSAIAFGAMAIARDPDLTDGVSPALLRALEGGVTLIDTARGYPQSEAIIGQTLRAWQGQRPLISSKLLPMTAATFRRHLPIEAAYTPASITASVEASLTALGVDTIDVIHLHQWFFQWGKETDWLTTLYDLRRAGKIRFLAVSAQDHEHDALLDAVDRRIIDCVQFIYNLFESRPAVSLLPLAQARGVGTIARCVLDSGGLTDGLDEARFADTLFLRHLPYADYRRRIDRLRDAYVGTVVDSLDELAVRFVLSDDRVSSITLGMHSRDFVDRNLAHADRGPLPADVVEDIRHRHVWSKNGYEALV